jgi:hypothetical protein
VNGWAFVVPPGVIMVTFLVECVAPLVIVKVAVTVVSLFAVTPVALTPDPEIFTAVAPVKPTPVRVSVKLVPCVPEVGLIDVKVGTITVKVMELVTPPGVVAVTFLVPAPAPAPIVNVAVTEVSLFTVIPDTVMPPPAEIAEVPVKPTPVSVTWKVLPRTWDDGLIAESDGAKTVNVTVLLVPPGVVTLTVLAVAPAVPDIVNVAVTLVSFTTLTPLTVMPLPETVIAEVSLRPVPVRVTATTLPRRAVAGLILVRTGTGMAPWYSTAPASTRLGEFGPLRGLPKKSVAGAFV